MNTLTLNAASVSSSTNSVLTNQAHTLVITQGLCCEIFDDLMDRDILGFLLSSAHMRKFFAQFAIHADSKVAKALSGYTQDFDAMDRLHQAILKKFSGIYIAEAAIKERSSMMTLLDRKYEEFVLALGTDEVQYEMPLYQLESVELAWKYRNACATGNLINSF